MTKDDIFQEAIKDVAFSKARKVVLPNEYKKLTASMKATCFSVADIMLKHELDAVKEALTQAIKEGVGVDEFIRQYGNKIGTVDTKTVIRNFGATAHNAIKFAEQLSAKDVLKYLTYSAVNDERTRETHMALHGVTAPVDDPIWLKIYPPNGHNCRCIVRSLTEEEAYNGFKNGEYRKPRASDVDNVDDGWVGNPLNLDGMKEVCKKYGVDYSGDKFNHFILIEKAKSEFSKEVSLVADIGFGPLSSSWRSKLSVKELPKHLITDSFIPEMIPVLNCWGDSDVDIEFIDAWKKSVMALLYGETDDDKEKILDFVLILSQVIR